MGSLAVSGTDQTLATGPARSVSGWERILDQLPTVGEGANGAWHYWKVDDDSGCPADDLERGERLGRETVTVLRAHPEGAPALRRILRDIDLSSQVAQGFLNALEAALLGRADA